MDQDEAWKAIDVHRLNVADLLDDLSDDEWRRPSLCEGWTVRDVAAHLALQQIGLLDALAQVTRMRGGMNRIIFDAARRKAARPTTEMIAEIRGMVGSRKHNIGVTYRETLIDILVHSQDIAVPLGRRLPLAPDAAAEAASRIWSLNWPFHAKKKLRGFRLTATDIPWGVGEGREVEGSIEELLLLLAGRTAGLPRLSGPGAAALTARLSRPSG